MPGTLRGSPQSVERLQRRLGELARRGGDARLFVERRHENRDVHQGAGRARASHSVAGAAVDVTGVASRHVAEADLDRLEAWLESGAEPSTLPRSPRPASGAVAGAARPQAPASECAPHPLPPGVRLEHVAHVQEVLVVDPSGAWHDRRAGAWWRVEVAGPAGVSAREEAVERPGRQLDVSHLIEEATARARALADARPIEGGEQPVVFAPGVGGVVVHELVGHALEADAVLAGRSRLTDGDVRFRSPHLDVFDDPRRGRLAWRVDDEGSGARPVALVRHGRVVGRLHDRRTAAACSASPTGHGRRSSFTDPIRPRMGCTFIGAGPDEPDALLRGVARGVYVRRLATASVDSRHGRALFRVLDADRIEHGRIGCPVTPCLIEIDLSMALVGIDGVASDLVLDRAIGVCVKTGQAMPSSVGAPTIRLRMARVFGDHSFKNPSSRSRLVQR